MREYKVNEVNLDVIDLMSCGGAPAPLNHGKLRTDTNGNLYVSSTGLMEDFFLRHGTVFAVG